MEMKIDIKESLTNTYGPNTYGFQGTISIGKKTPTSKAVIMRGDWVGTGTERYSGMGSTPALADGVTPAVATPPPATENSEIAAGSESSDDKMVAPADSSRDHLTESQLSGINEEMFQAFNSWQHRYVKSENPDLVHIPMVKYPDQGNAQQMNVRLQDGSLYSYNFSWNWLIRNGEQQLNMNVYLAPKWAL
jgi:hypothetical protein